MTHIGQLKIFGQARIVNYDSSCGRQRVRSRRVATTTLGVRLITRSHVSSNGCVNVSISGLVGSKAEPSRDKHWMTHVLSAQQSKFNFGQVVSVRDLFPFGRLESDLSRCATHVEESVR